MRWDIAGYGETRRAKEEVGDDTNMTAVGAGEQEAGEEDVAAGPQTDPVTA